MRQINNPSKLDSRPFQQFDGTSDKGMYGTLIAGSMSRNTIYRTLEASSRVVAVMSGARQPQSRFVMPAWHELHT